MHSTHIPYTTHTPFMWARLIRTQTCLESRLSRLKWISSAVPTQACSHMILYLWLITLSTCHLQWSKMVGHQSISVYFLRMTVHYSTWAVGVCANDQSKSTVLQHRTAQPLNLILTAGLGVKKMVIMALMILLVCFGLLLLDGDKSSLLWQGTPSCLATSLTAISQLVLTSVHDGLQ